MEGNPQTDGNGGVAPGPRLLLSHLDGDLQRVVLDAVQQGRQRAVDGFFQGRLVAIARQVAQPQAGALHLDLDPVLLAVAVVGRRVAERVIAVEVLLHPRQLGTQVVGVEVSGRWPLSGLRAVRRLILDV